MKWKMIMYAGVTILKNIDPDDVRELADAGLDVLENKFADNKVVMAMCTIIRNAFSIEDND